MTVLGWILGITAIFCGIILMWHGISKESVGYLLWGLLIVLANLYIIFSGIQKDEKRKEAEQEEVQRTIPTALDVYRGRTTLQITYKDSIPIDTVVVFKDSI